MAYMIYNVIRRKNVWMGGESQEQGRSEIIEDLFTELSDYFQQDLKPECQVRG